MAGKREASIKVTVDGGAFRSGMRKLASDVDANGRRMGKALKGPIAGGLSSAKKAMGGLLGGLRQGVRMAASFGGALSVGILVKGATELNSLYRDISFNISKVQGNAIGWKEVQELVDDAAVSTGQNARGMADAFDAVFKATGDLEFAKSILNDIGTVATATGADTMDLARAAELLNRKFGLKDAQAGLTRIIEKTGVGGIGLEDMTRRFGIMATEAVAAGVKGEEGVSRLLGTMIELDATVGEQAAPAMKLFFQKLKDGTVDLERLKKASGLEFEEGEDFTSKLRKILSSEKALAEAKKTFTAESRIVFDVLAKPFLETFDDVIKSGGKRQDAVRKGLDQFDAAMKRSGESTLKFSALQDQANERLREDPTVLLQQAITKVQVAFAQPKMIDALTKLAAQLPAFADGIADIVSFIVDKPLQAALIALSARILLAAGAGFAGSAGKKVVGAAGGLVKGAAGALAGVGAGGAGVAGAGGAAAVGGAAIAAGALLAAGAAGAAVGTVVSKTAVQPAMEKEFATIGAGTADVLLTAFSAAQSGDIGRKRAALDLIAKQKKAVEDNASIFNTAVGNIASIIPFSDARSPEALRAESLNKLGREEDKLKTQIERRRKSEELLAQVSSRLSQSMSLMAESAKTFSEATTRGVNPPPASNPGAGTTAPPG